MTVNLESFRYPFETEIANESEGAKTAHRNAFQGILDLNQAVASLKTQLTSATTTTSTTSSSSSTSTTSATETVVTNSATTTIGYVNDQTGVTAYTTLQSDYAKFIILDDASAIAVTLSVASSSPAITLPWYANFLNYGAGTATLTPIDGTISYTGNLAAASMPIEQGYAGAVVYDGTDFWADAIPIATLSQFGLVKPDGVTIDISAGVISVPTATYTSLGLIEAVAAVSHEWINSINTSGIPQLSQPAIADISGLAAALALLAPLASPTFTGSITSPIVYGGSATGSTLTLDGTSNGSPSNAYVLINSSSQGNVGIGLTNPFTTFHINATSGTPASSGNVNTGIVISSSTGGPSLNLGNSNSSGAHYSWIQSAYVNSAGTTEALVLQQIGGNVGIGTVTPHSPLAVTGLPVYASNAAAITGGLAAGDFYRTGGDPDPVCVVH